MTTPPNPIVTLVARHFAIDPATIVREDLDHAWAPVERWHLHASDPAVPVTVVVKTRRQGGSGWGYDPRNLVAERRALELLDPTGLAPRLHLASDELGAIVMEDIADARTVEAILFDADPAAAHDALVRLATAFGRMHAASTPIDPQPWNPASILMTPIRASWATVITAVRDLRLPDPEHTSGEIEDLASALADPAWWALTHADANPSNVLIVGERTVIVDFEAANPRHIGIDGGGFALGFPSYRYWAALPGDSISAMIDAWRSAIATAFPATASDATFGSLLATSALAWAIPRLSRLPLIADNREPPDESHRRRSQIVHMTDLAVATCHAGETFPAIASWLEELGAAMRARWPESTTPRQFPAFTGGSRGGWVVFHDI